jgi:5-keto-L-gluconate epimerase
MAEPTPLSALSLSVAIAAKGAPPDAFVVWRGFEESIERASSCGYDGVELALKEAAEVDPKALDRWLARSGLRVSAISSGQVFATLGLTFTDPDPAGRRRVVDVFKGLMDLAADFGGLVNIGRARGSYRVDQPRPETERLFIETARELCDYGKRRNVALMIEPVNRYEINFINSVDQGAELLARVERTNIGLMPDVFHMNIEDARIGESLVRNGRLVRYIHLADSNRRAPGMGHLDFEEVFAALRSVEYRGWASVEILPLPDADRAAEHAARTLRPMIDRYNDTNPW